ncbi:MAG TPA: putative porin [Taishania sp.]|nr:putative porin [Taishania sp.]
MRLKFAIVFYLIVPLFGYSQKSPILGIKDTLKFNYTTGGTIDSVDINFSQHSSTLPGGGFSTSENSFAYDFFVQNSGGSVFRNFTNWKKMRFSALPHLGFGYIFGGQQTQIVKANYTHALSENQLLNIDYDMQRGSNFMRNGLFGHHDVQLQYQLKTNFYTLDLKGQYLSRLINQNDGLLTDSTLYTSGLDMSPVRKDIALSKQQGGRVNLNHYFDFLPKDSINATGLYIENRLNIFNRKYKESSDTLDLIYPVINISTDSTSDQYQLSQIANGAGLYYDRPGFYLKAGLDYNYWNYFNLGQNQDRSEVNLDGKLGIQIKRIEIENHTNINMIGAAGEWFTNTNIRFGWKNFKLNGKADISYLLPEPFQRSYYANNVSYNTQFDQLNKQFKLNLHAQLSYVIKQHSISVFAGNATATNTYWFINNSWRNDTLTTLNALTIGIAGQTGYKALRFSLKASYNKSNWMPEMLIQSRLYVQGRLFKGKKLLAQIGVEGAYLSSYQLLEHLPYMDVFNLTNQIGSSRTNLHVFGAFEVSRFRFFFRVENLGKFWTEPIQRIAFNQTIPNMQIRIGITWDFFN